MTVPDGIAEVIAALEAGTFGDPFDGRYREHRLSSIPLFDFRAEEDDLAAVAEALRSGWLTSGPRTEASRPRSPRASARKHAVAVSSCTAALHLAYLAAGVGPGDEVIVPSFTFAATAAAVIYCGATPVFADIVGLHDAVDRSRRRRREDHARAPRR